MPKMNPGGRAGLGSSGDAACHHRRHHLRRPSSRRRRMPGGPRTTQGSWRWMRSMTDGSRGRRRRRQEGRDGLSWEETTKVRGASTTGPLARRLKSAGRGPTLPSPFLGYPTCQTGRQTRRFAPGSTISRGPVVASPRRPGRPREARTRVREERKVARVGAVRYRMGHLNEGRRWMSVALRSQCVWAHPARPFRACASLPPPRPLTNITRGGTWTLGPRRYYPSLLTRGPRCRDGAVANLTRPWRSQFSAYGGR